MSTRSERDRQKSSQERHQSILSQLLKDEDNKYCVDCDAKGPRWASWNLGIFLCIRCAGIHRNLGVHISKVKSVNLDSWTGEQVAMMQEMGNSRARAVYEANLPDNFRRPQTDSGLEAFIRGKYEQKRYIAREWIPPQPKVQPTYDEPKKEKKRTRPKPQTSQNMPVSTATVQAKAEEPKPAPKPAPVPSRQEAAAADLLSLDADPVPQSDAGQADLFGDFVANPLPTEAPLQPTLNAGDASAVASSSPATATAESQPAADGIDLFGESSGGEEQRKAQKKDILALYASSGTPNQQMFGVPGGMYMPQQAPMMQNNMMPNAAMMQMQPQQQQQMQQVPQQQQMMMGGGAPGMQQGYYGMPQNAGGMMGQYQQPPPQQQQQQQGMYGNMGNMNMYAMQQPQFQQIQNQMASMALGPSANSFQQQPTPIAAGGTPAGNYGNWGGQPMGQTLSGNLWK